MKKCMHCHTIYTSEKSQCPSCRAIPELKDNISIFAPECAEDGSGFKGEYFEELVELEANNFWFKSRNQLICWAIQKYCPSAQTFLEVGCGTGFVLSGITDRFPQIKLSGSELFIEGLDFAASRNPHIEFMQMDARKIPFVEEFNAIGAFDVLEHIEEDELVLEQIRNALTPNGTLLITVPQHKWLWSPVDDYACHVRRYSASELHKKVESAGFEILRSSSFITSLLPMMWVSRFLKKQAVEDFDPVDELKLPPILNLLFEKILAVEAFIIRLGINFPLGGSRILIARKLSK